MEDRQNHSDPMGEHSETLSLLGDVPRNVASILPGVDSLLTRIKNEEFDTSKGINFLDVKNQMLLSYLTNLTYVALRKFSGAQLENDASIERLVEIRTVLEKMKPIDKKLNYHVQKMTTTAMTGKINPNDPLLFKPRPDNLVNQLTDQESEGHQSEEEEKAKPQSNVYVPPKISATYYEGEETQRMKQQKQMQHVKRKALSSGVMRELRKEHNAGPEEINEARDFHRPKFGEEMKERIRYEEDYMLRLPLTKNQRHESRRVSTISSLSNAAKFSDVSVMECSPNVMPIQKKRNSKKFSQKKGKRKSFKRKRM